MNGLYKEKVLINLDCLVGGQIEIGYNGQMYYQALISFFKSKRLNLFFVIISLLLLQGCASYKQFQYITEEFEVPSKVFRATFDETWKVLQLIMRNYELENQSIESGYMKTRWIDNTMELNFTDAFGKSDTVKTAKFKLIINVVKGYRASRQVTKVSIFKRQMVEPDFLQGWKVLRSDSILEKTILYRLTRLLAIDKKLKELEDAKNKEVEENF